MDLMMASKKHAKLLAFTLLIVLGTLIIFLDESTKETDIDKGKPFGQWIMTSKKQKSGKYEINLSASYNPNFFSTAKVGWDKTKLICSLTYVICYNKGKGENLFLYPDSYDPRVDIDYAENKVNLKFEIDNPPSVYSSIIFDLSLHLNEEYYKSNRSHGGFQYTIHP